MDLPALHELLAAIQNRVRTQSAEFSDAGIENIGLVCWHLFRPRAAKAQGALVRLTDQLDSRELQRLLRAIKNRAATSDSNETPIKDQETESFQTSFQSAPKPH